MRKMIPIIGFFPTRISASALFAKVYEVEVKKLVLPKDYISLFGNKPHKLNNKLHNQSPGQPSIRRFR